MINWDVTFTFKNPNLHLKWNQDRSSMIYSDELQLTSGISASPSTLAEAEDLPTIQISKTDFEDMEKNQVLSFMDLEPRNILLRPSPNPERAERNPEGKLNTN
jgi:hypothetical protein